MFKAEHFTKVTSAAKSSDQQEFTAEDIRFTTHNGALYAIALGWPKSGELRVHSLWKENPYLTVSVCGVKLLGAEQDISWRQTTGGLYIQLPMQPPTEPAFTFRIMEPQGRSLHCGN